MNIISSNEINTGTCTFPWTCKCFLILIPLCINFAGDDSGKVTIWNMAPVKDEEDEMNENVPKLLCQMDNHLGELNFNIVLV